MKKRVLTDYERLRVVGVLQVLFFFYIYTIKSVIIGLEVIEFVPVCTCIVSPADEKVFSPVTTENSEDCVLVVSKPENFHKVNREKENPTIPDNFH